MRGLPDPSSPQGIVHHAAKAVPHGVGALTNTRALKGEHHRCPTCLTSDLSTAGCPIGVAALPAGTTEGAAREVEAHTLQSCFGVAALTSGTSEGAARKVEARTLQSYSGVAALTSSTSEGAARDVESQPSRAVKEGATRDGFTLCIGSAACGNMKENTESLTVPSTRP